MTVYMEEEIQKTEPAEASPEALTFHDARRRGYYSVSTLRQKHLKPVGSPVCSVRSGRHLVRLYDIRQAVPLEEASAAAPMMQHCRLCGTMTGSETGICHKCAQAQKSRAESDVYEAEKQRAAAMDPACMVFLDLEMTGDARADEILSVSMTDGNGRVLLDTLIHPKTAKSWPFTVKIHHITPKMVKNAPTVDDVEEQIARILRDADEILGYSIANDWKYLRALPAVAPEAEQLHDKVRCCQVFYDRFIKNDMPELETGKRSLTGAMAALGLDWDGKQHSSLADTLACLRVWRRLFLERELIVLPAPEPDGEAPLEATADV